MSGFSYRWCLNEEDYKIVCDMMSGWNMAALHRRMLSENGAIVSKNGIDVCSGWLYQSDSKMAWIEWVVMNRKAPKEVRDGALDFLYETLFNRGRELGFEVVICAVNHPSLMERLKNKLGFVEDTSVDVKLLYKNICQQ